MELSGFDFYDNSTWFVNGIQRDAVRDIVFKLADDRYQEDCRYLMRFWWHLLDGHTYNTKPSDFDQYVSPPKVRFLEELFEAIASNPEAVKDWIEKYRTIG